ncbi:MAG: hypothetical protein Q9220_000621 [cf. Caloplaca sp. 1 TL-2023]
MSDSHMMQLIERQTAPSSSSSSKAFAVPPDQNWDGNDGSWSTFIIQVGSPPQYFRVLPSINGQETWIPVPIDCQQGPSWCGNARGVEPFKSPSTATTLSTLDVGSTCSANKSPSCVGCNSIDGRCTIGFCAGRYCCGSDPGACNSAGCNGVSAVCTAAYIGCACTGDDYDVQSNELKSPGAANPAAANGFQFNQSSTWSLYGNYTLQGVSQLPVSASGLYGADLVTVGPSANAALIPGLASTVAGITTEPYYLGLLGLQPSSSSRFNTSSPSLMSLLKSQKLIPSLSFGYTAGASYHSQGVLGSLTLGGYDQSKFVKNDVTFNINQGNAKALRAGIRSVDASNTLIGNTNLLSDNITATIDSDLPYLYLPTAMCKKFETAFGLSWDAARQLYLVNDTIHGSLRSLNPSISFSLGPSATQMTNVTLPYLAFDLQVTQPIAENGTNYFPLRCTSNSSQYVLGRAFLQETYLVVDYETSNFSISQAQFTNQSEIVTINHSSGNSTTGDNPAGSGGPALSNGAIAGIAIGASVAVVLVLSLLVILIRRSRRQSQDHSRGPPSISGPIPFDSTKDSWPNSPTSSGDHNTQPPMSALSNTETPFQRFEERLERLERANTTHLPPYSNTWDGGHGLRSEVSGENVSTQLRSTAGSNAHDKPKQELAGSPAARELQDAHLSGRLPPKPVKHVFELAGDDSRRTGRRR